MFYSIGMWGSSLLVNIFGRFLFFVFLILSLFSFFVFAQEEEASDTTGPLQITITPQSGGASPWGSQCSLPDCTRHNVVMSPRSGSCKKHILDMACRYSPWRKLNLVQRIDRIKSHVSLYNALHGWNMDVNAMLCLFAKEGYGMEPFLLNFGGCGKKSSATDTGLGQVNALTVGDLICNQGFRSQHPHFANFKCVVSEKKYKSQGPGKTKRAYAVRTGLPFINKMLAYPEVQIEVAMAALKMKAGGRENGFKQIHFVRYNAGAHAQSYGRTVYNNCYLKARGKSSSEIVPFLNAMVKGGTVSDQYKQLRARCTSGTEVLRSPRPPKVLPKREPSS